MSKITIGDLIKLPNALLNEMEVRSAERAQAQANHFINRITGRNLPLYNSFNRYNGTNGESHQSEFMDAEIYEMRIKHQSK